MPISDIYPDPIARAAEEEEKRRYHYDLFHPIYEFQSVLETRWLIPNWIPEGYLVILAAGPKQGKTSLATQLALAVATGTPFAGMPTVQGSVLWMSLEEDGPERRLLLTPNPLSDPSTPLYTCYESLPLDAEETFEALDYWIDKTKAKLIVIDPLQAASLKDLTNNRVARKTLQTLKRFCHSRRITALVLHHAKEPSRSQARVAESDQLSATASMYIVMKHRKANLTDDQDESKDQPQEETKRDARLITLACRGRGTFANRTISLYSASPSDYQLADAHHLIQPAPPSLEPYGLAQVLSCILKCPATMIQICARTNTTPYIARNCVAHLRAKGLVRMHAVGQNQRIYANANLSGVEATAAFEANEQLQEEQKKKSVESDVIRESVAPQDQIPPEMYTQFSKSVSKNSEFVNIRHL